MSNKQNDQQAHFNQIFNKHFGRITTEAAKKLRSDCIDELLALHKASTDKAVREAEKTVIDLAVKYATALELEWRNYRGSSNYRDFSRAFLLERLEAERLANLKPQDTE